ncbi:hypothetical protein HAX54_014619 [Datura stramonium]|uniref:Uncharacterized protein n=1 Tax=Datura stramonium TaxID=4076 RepID=A0ABS8TQ62_DATST|nr:hypothetical protein [Datura stramonium]
MFWLGFGFDPKNLDFKVVRLAYLGGLNGGCIEAESKNEDEEITNNLLVFDLSHETISEMGLPRVLAQVHVSSWDLFVTLCEIREFKDLDIHGRSESFFLSKYDESLVLLDGSCGATTDPSIASESEEATELQPKLGQTSMG